MQDIKGIVGNVIINKEIFISWEMYLLNLDNIIGWEKLCIYFISKMGDVFMFIFYLGFIYFILDGILKDIFMRF